MQAPVSAQDVVAFDKAAIDDAVEGVTAGHGLLASMLSWIRGVWSRAPGPGQLVAGVVTPELEHVDPKLSRTSDQFEPAELMRALIRYCERYSAQLSGRGLLLSLGQQLPPSAFPVLEGTAPFGSPLDSSTFNVGDYQDRDAAIRAIGALGFSADSSPGQLAWLANAAMVRTAVSMAPFVFAAPRLEVGGPNDAPVLVFAHKGRPTYIQIDKTSSPLSLHRHVRLVIQNLWQARLGTQTERVAQEFVQALQAQRLPKKVMEGLEVDLKAALGDFKPLAKMRHSAAAFIDIRAIARECFAFIDQVDRVAARNALRHNSQGLQWPGYLTHRNPAFQAEIAQHEPAGALAFARYSQSLMSSLWHCNGTNRDVQAVGPIPSSPAGGGGSGAGVWASATGDDEYAGTITRQFMRSLDAHASEAARQALSDVTPRYLCVVAVGHPAIASFEKQLNAHVGVRPDAARIGKIAQAAGRRLADALSRVVHETPAGRPSLPWARVLNSSSCYDLLLSLEGDELAVFGLVNLIKYANAQRTRGVRASEALWDLPLAQECMDAPAGNPVGSLMGRLSAPTSNRWNRARNAALGLVRNLVATVEPVTTQTLESSGKQSRALQWVPQLAALKEVSPENENLAGGFMLALCNPGTRRGGTWSVMTVTAHTNEEFSHRRAQRIDHESFAFAVRGKGTPDTVAPLVMEVKLPEHMRFRAIANRRPNAAGWSPIAMQSIGDCGLTNPHLAARIADEDRQAIPHMPAHARTAMAYWADRIGTMLARHPYQSAAAFPAVAAFLRAGGCLADNRALRPLGTTAAFRLGLACVGSTNVHGMALICHNVTRPGHRSSSGATLLDLALESVDHRVAAAALDGLRENSKLAAEPGGLARLVQGSMGKLVERHPELIPLALKLGAHADETSKLAWEHLHPMRRGPELEAAFNEALMRAVIERSGRPRANVAPNPLTVSVTLDSTPQPASSSEPHARRRRVGAV